MSWLFGHRFAVVTYKGRRSDRTCRTVLWVYRYLPDTGAITVVSVWGDSDWLRNIRSKPATLIQAGRNGFVAGQQFLGTGQIVALVKAFRRDHRWIAPGQARLMRWPWPATDEQLRTICGQMRAVTFSPALHGPCDTSGMGRGPRERSLSSAVDVVREGDHQRGAYSLRQSPQAARADDHPDGRQERMLQASTKQRPEATGPPAGSPEDPGAGMALSCHPVR
jgi:hypothetical protein